MSLIVTLKAFQLSGFSFAGGTATLPASARTHVGVNVASGAIVQTSADTNVDRTVIWLATCTTSATDVLLCIQHDPLIQIELNDYVSTAANFVDIATGQSAPSYKAGRVFWDEEAKALAYYSDITGVTMQIGREMWSRVRNNSGATIANGKPVYVTGAIGKLPTIALASANTNSVIDVLGVATMDIPNNGYGYITTFGAVNDLNTSAWAEGQQLYLGTTPGTYSTTPPEAPAVSVSMGLVLAQHVSAGAMGVRVCSAGGGASGNRFLQIYVDTISEQTVDNGVSVDRLLIKDGGITGVGPIVVAPASGEAAIRAVASGGTGAAITLLSTATDCGTAGIGTFKAGGVWAGWLAHQTKDENGIPTGDYFGTGSAPTEVNGSWASTLTCSTGKKFGIADCGQVDVNTNYGTLAPGAKQSIRSGGPAGAAAWSTNCQYESVWAGGAPEVRPSNCSCGDISGEYVIVAGGVTHKLSYLGNILGTQFGQTYFDGANRYTAEYSGASIKTFKALLNGGTFQTITAIYRLT